MKYVTRDGNAIVIQLPQVRNAEGTKLTPRFHIRSGRTWDKDLQHTYAQLLELLSPLGDSPTPLARAAAYEHAHTVLGQTRRPRTIQR
jgi:hypothetical protein